MLTTTTPDRLLFQLTNESEENGTQQALGLSFSRLYCHLLAAKQPSLFTPDMLKCSDSGFAFAFLHILRVSHQLWSTVNGNMTDA